MLQTGVPWEQLDGATVLVTGAAGFLGAYAAETLLARNEPHGENTRVLALVRSEQKAKARYAHALGRPDLNCASVTPRRRSSKTAPSTSSSTRRASRSTVWTPSARCCRTRCARTICWSWLCGAVARLSLLLQRGGVRRAGSAPRARTRWAAWIPRPCTAATRKENGLAKIFASPTRINTGCRCASSGRSLPTAPPDGARRRPRLQRLRGGPGCRRDTRDEERRSRHPPVLLPRGRHRAGFFTALLKGQPQPAVQRRQPGCRDLHPEAR